MSCKNANISGTINSSKIQGNSEITLNTSGGLQLIKVIKNNDTSHMAYMTDEVVGINNGDYYIDMGTNGLYSDGTCMVSLNILDAKGVTHVRGEGIKTPALTQTSLESIKKNVSLYNEDALKLIKNAEIYSYNLKSEKDTDKKHIGFVIGDKYKTPQEVIAKSGDGIDIYSMCSILWKAVQELTEEIEKLKGGKANG